MKKLMVALVLASVWMTGCGDPGYNTYVESMVQMRHFQYARGLHDGEYPGCGSSISFTRSGTATRVGFWKEYRCKRGHVILIEQDRRKEGDA